MNGAKNKLIALDSNVFIYHFEHNLKYTPYTTKIFSSFIENSNHGVTSVISIGEALSYPAPSSLLKKIEEKFRNLPNFIIFDVTQEIAIKTAQIRRNYKFRLPDSIQLATARHTKAEIFITNDKNMKKFKEVKVVLLEEFKC